MTAVKNENRWRSYLGIVAYVNRNVALSNRIIEINIGIVNEQMNQ